MPKEILYKFGEFQLNPLRRRLLHHGALVRVTPTACDLLSVFVTHNGETLSKRELITSVWAVQVVTDNNFNVTLNAVRRALGDSGRDPKYILKVSRGYCFVADVHSGFEGEP